MNGFDAKFTNLKTVKFGVTREEWSKNRESIWKPCDLLVFFFL